MTTKKAKKGDGFHVNYNNNFGFQSSINRPEQEMCIRDRLHMGHMLNNTIQDIVVRRARMEGKNACWVSGTDHASIATDAKVVYKLAAQGIKKRDLTRDEFLKHAWDWTEEHGGIILSLIHISDVLSE